MGCAARELDTVTRMEFYLPPQGVSSLMSMAHFCPGLHGPGCNHHCKWLSFRAFFEVAHSGRRQLIIPLFQRSYCWHQAMLEGWWRDATAGRRGHRVGTVFTKDRGDTRTTVVIDGQQRLTTAMLLVAALRDAALGLLQQAGAASAGQGMMGQGGGSAEAFVLDGFVEQLEAALYIDGGAAAVPQWALRTASSLRRGELQWGGVHPAGAQFPLALLQPSFVDRAAFFQLITIGRVRHAGTLLDPLERPAPPAEPEPPSEPPSDHPHRGQHGAAPKGACAAELCRGARSTLLASAKMFFDGAVRDDLRRWRAGGTGAQIGRLQQLGRGALDALVLQSVSIVNPINYTQVFLYLQENDLFGGEPAGAAAEEALEVVVPEGAAGGDMLALHAEGGVVVEVAVPAGAKPGDTFEVQLPGEAAAAPVSDGAGGAPAAVRFRGSDLVRNLLLSVYAARGLEEQERLLLERWIQPIELRCADGPDGLDALIGAFLDSEQAERGPWLACELEQRVAKLEAGAAVSARRPGVVLYARFVSRVAALESELQEAEVPAVEGGRDTAAVNDVAALHSGGGGMAALAVATDGATLTLAPALEPTRETPALVEACEAVLRRLAQFAAATS